jgi:hypothetical protein
MPVFDESVSIVRQPPPRSDTKEAEEVEAYLQDLAQDQLRLIQLLPVAQIALTENETQQIQVFQAAQLVLGPAATAPMTCSEKCPTPIRSNCLLAQFGKEPIGKKCPYEQQYIGQRFISWMQELGRTISTLLESERSAISTLLMLDLQERRCNQILSDAENARLTSQSVRDADFNGKPIAWEDVIHANTLRLDSIAIQRRQILRDLELTPEMKTKRQKALGQMKQTPGDLLANRQAETAEKVRRALRGEPLTIDVP